MQFVSETHEGGFKERSLHDGGSGHRARLYTNVAAISQNAAEAGRSNPVRRPNKHLGHFLIFRHCTMQVGFRAFWRECMDSWVNLASVVTAFAATVTMGFLICYTIETSRLRRAAQKQNEIAIMPVVVLEFGSAERALSGHMKLEEPQIHNIGNGPAFNIRVQTIAGTDLEVRFDSVPLLDKAGIEKLRFTIWQGKATTGFSRKTVFLASVITSGQLGTEMRIAAVFADSAGTQYRASYVVRYDPDAKETVTTFVGQHKMT